MKKIDFDEFQEVRMANGARASLIVNVLSPEDYSHNHIPGSINVPFKGNDHFATQIENLAGGKDKNVVVYCGGPQCPLSTKAAQALEDAGFSAVSDFKGGQEEWEEQGGYDLLGDNLDDFGGRGINTPPAF